MFKPLLPALAALSLAAPALADEVWSSDYGQIVYLADEYGAAILSFTDYDGMTGELVFPGLAGNFTERDVHHGYWIGQSDWHCDAGLGRPGGVAMHLGVDPWSVGSDLIGLDQQASCQSECEQGGNRHCLSGHCCGVSAFLGFGHITVRYLLAPTRLDHRCGMNAGTSAA